MIGITEYIQQIYEDFSEYYDEGHNMCELKKLTFEAGGLPNYNSKRMQQFYLLRYAFAYSLENAKRAFAKNEKCEKYMEYGKNCKKNCRTYLTRWPILKTSNICYQIIKFERK